MRKLQQNWWFLAAISFFSTVITIPLMISAGIWPARGFAQWLIYFVCVLGCWRLLSFLFWLLIVLVRPTSKVLD